MRKLISYFSELYLTKYSALVFFLLFLFHTYFGIIPGWKAITSDFPNYYVSAKLLTEQKDLSVLYDNNLFNSKIKEYGIDAKGQFALYPPANAIILVPLSSFDPLTAKRIWLLINIILIALCGYLISRITSWNFIHSLNILFISGFALANDLFLGQVYLFMTSMLIAGYLFFQQQKKYLPGIMWGAIVAFKYVPVIFIPALVIKKKWKTLLGIIFIFVLINLICIPYFGMDAYLNFIKSIFFSHFWGNLYEGNPYSIKYQSWESLLNNLFVYHTHFNPHPVFNLPAGYWICKVLIWIGVAAALIYFYIRSYTTKYFFETVFSLSVISLLVLEPGSATYHLLFLILPFIIIAKILSDSNEPDQLFYFTFLFFLTGVLPTLLNKFSLFTEGNLVLSFHRLWLEMIFYFYSVLTIYRFLKKQNIQGY